jgi:hypothetical protein
LLVDELSLLGGQTERSFGCRGHACFLSV